MTTETPYIILLPERHTSLQNTRIMSKSALKSDTVFTLQRVDLATAEPGTRVLVRATVIPESKIIEFGDGRRMHIGTRREDLTAYLAPTQEPKP